MELRKKTELAILTLFIGGTIAVVPHIGFWFTGLLIMIGTTTAIGSYWAEHILLNNPNKNKVRLHMVLSFILLGLFGWIGYYLIIMNQNKN